MSRLASDVELLLLLLLLAWLATLSTNLAEPSLIASSSALRFACRSFLIDKRSSHRDRIELSGEIGYTRLQPPLRGCSLL